MPGFITDNALKERLRDYYQRTDLDGFHDSMITRASAWAYGLIVRGLARRGYSLAQITAAEGMVELQTDLTFWKVTIEVAKNQPEGWSKQALKDLDRREELTSNDAEKQFVVITAGKFIYPDGTTGQVTTGPEDTSDDLFGTDPDDHRRGHVTRF